MPPKPAPPPIVHARVLSRRVGIASIPLDLVDLHADHRDALPSHIATLKKELDKDPNSRWAHPIDLVIGARIPKPWIKKLESHRFTLDPPDAGRFVCIGGQHRLLAAKEVHAGWKPTEEEPVANPALGSYPATIYEASVLDDEELPVWMMERNLFRPSLSVTIRDRLQVASDVKSYELQTKALGLLGWGAKEAACIISLRNSTAWEGLMSLLLEPLYRETASGTIVDWAIEYRSYPMLQLMIEDILQQQRQLVSIAKPDSIITMDFLFGAKSSHNQHIRKTGTHDILTKIWNSAQNSTWDYFDVASFPELWRKATLRVVEAPDLEVGSPFLFGQLIPSIHDINYHSFDSAFSDRMHRCEVAASKLHILLSYPLMVSIPARRPKRADHELDWVEILDGAALRSLSKPNRARGERVIRLLLKNVDLLVQPGKDFMRPIKHDSFPHMIVLADKSKVSEYIDAMATPPWIDIIHMCAELGLRISKDVTERWTAATRPNPNTPPPAQPSQPDPMAPPGAAKDASDTDSDEPSEGEKEKTPRPSKPVAANQQQRAKKRKRLGVKTTVTSPGGTVLDEGYVYKRQAKRKGPAQPQVPSSQSVIEQEDEDGLVWDGYRLPTSPSQAKYVHGLAYQDPETGRVRVARAPPPRGLRVAELDEEDEDLSPSTSFIRFAARLQRLSKEDADRILLTADVEHEEVERWHTELDELMEDE